MATRWTSRVNPFSWVTRRRNRPAVVVPGGRAEFEVPAEYVTSTVDDYTAADRPSFSTGLEWFAEEGEDESDIPLTFGTSSLTPGRPRTRVAGYSNGTLLIEFRDGAVYAYDGISESQWEDLQLKSTTSTGKWMARNGIGGPGSGRKVN